MPQQPEPATTAYFRCLLPTILTIYNIVAWYRCFTEWDHLNIAANPSQGEWYMSASQPPPLVGYALVVNFCWLIIHLLDAITDEQATSLLIKAWIILRTLVNRSLSLVQSLPCSNTERIDNRSAETWKTSSLDIAILKEETALTHHMDPNSHLARHKHDYTCLIWQQRPTTSSDILRIVLPTDQLSQCLIRDEDDLSCGLCLEEYKAGDITRLLPCSHRYHLFCIDDLIRRSFGCPYCRQEFRWILALKHRKAVLEKLES